LNILEAENRANGAAAPAVETPTTVPPIEKEEDDEEEKDDADPGDGAKMVPSYLDGRTGIRIN